MCYHAKLSKTARELQQRFKAKFERDYAPGIYNGFAHPKTPVITDALPGEIQLFGWGLLPVWAKDTAIRKTTLNARIETAAEKPGFRNAANNRCLVLADGFYEWQWLDPKGKRKQKYELTLPDGGAFAFAGLWSEWTDRATGEILQTYTVLTTAANELMATVHNTKKRMPVIVAVESETDWLMGGELKMQNDRLMGTPVP